VVAPDHLLVGVRGRSNEEGVTRYFRRFDALRYDQDHLAAEGAALALFVRAAVTRYGGEGLRRAALGYSNGANIALATQLLSPSTFGALALLRAVQPFERPPVADLGGTEVLLLLGRDDPYRAAGQGLPSLLEKAGASVEQDVLDAGHNLTQEDVARLAAWFAALGA
jgi:phospholipase/carboxylesterase